MNYEDKGLTQKAYLILELLKRRRKKKYRNDFRGFCLYYFAHYFSLSTSPLHEELFETLQVAVDDLIADNIVRAAPRGNAKSTIVSLALPIWCYIYKKKHYMLLVSDTVDQASDFLINIRSEFEENDRLKNDFGKLIGLTWTSTDIINPDQDVRIQALGVGKRVRGRRFKQWRPDLMICDDIENDENVTSPDQRAKNRSWYFKALSKAGGLSTDKIFVGTVMHTDSLLSNLLVNPIYDSKIYKSVISWSNSKLWDQWEKIVTNLADLNHIQTGRNFFEEHKEEMLAGTQVLWEAREDYYSLMLMRIAEGPAAFSSEKQNEPISDDERRFLSEWIYYYDDSELIGKKLINIGFVDPSLGKMGGDYSAIITIGMDQEGYIYILDADLEKRHPDKIIDTIIMKHQKYEYSQFGVEEVQFQEFFKDSLIKRSSEMGVDIPILGVRQVRDKVLRIQSLQPDIKSHRIRFRRDQQTLINQIINFPSDAHDDGPDALEGAISIAGSRSAIADYYKEAAYEQSKQNVQSLFTIKGIQGIIK